MTETDTPEWARDAVFYQIFPDRFACSPRVPKPSNLEPWDTRPTAYGFKGGDLLGVVERLDYLQDLGVTAIYLNPVFESTANHRYHTYDYYQVDPILGGNDALHTLLVEAKRAKMHVILDGVFNHASRGFFQFNHILENGMASPYIDWFTVKSWPLRPYGAPPGEHGYESWWDLPALPKFNVNTRAVRDFLWDVATHWISFGINGWRLDVPGEIDDDEFWQEFRRRVKSVNNEAYIVGEVWGDARRWLAGDQFDAVMNYLFTRACLGFFVGDNLFRSEVLKSGHHHIDTIDAEGFAREIDHLLGFYPRAITEVQFNLLGSHDTPRFKTLARGDNSAYELATLFQMTFPGTPSIYYGDEIGMEGRHDPDCRGAFPWDAEHCWDHGLRDRVRWCISLRKAHPALRRGTFTWLFAGHGVVAYGRQLAEETLIILLNVSQRSATLSVPLNGYLPDSTLLRNIENGETLAIQQGIADGIRVGPRAGVVLQAIDPTTT